MVHRILAAFAVVAAATGVTRSAPAYCRSTTCAAAEPPASCGAGSTRRDPVTGCLRRGIPLFWQERCVSFSVHHEGSPELLLDYSEAEAIVARAFAVWPGSNCGSSHPSITPVSLGPLECDQREFHERGPNANAVLFRGHDWPHDRRAIALTTVNFSPSTGQIFGADMEINAEDYPLTEASLVYVVTHEAGHFFGLDHSNDRSAVMYEDYAPLTETTAPVEPLLTPDDVAGICAIYPPDRAVSQVCSPEPELGFAVDCGGDVVGSCAVGPGRGAASAHGLLATMVGVALLALGRCRRRRGSGRGITSCCPAAKGVKCSVRNARTARGPARSDPH
ncbi:MAG TPA: matrixin family metalloprotease [Polyangiaceae bacterium]